MRHGERCGRRASHEGPPADLVERLAAQYVFQPVVGSLYDALGEKLRGPAAFPRAPRCDEVSCFAKACLEPRQRLAAAVFALRGYVDREEPSHFPVPNALRPLVARVRSAETSLAAALHLSLVGARTEVACWNWLMGTCDRAGYSTLGRPFERYRDEAATRACAVRTWMLGEAWSRGG